jgi:glycosyltransferase involved in cell wall biosynthesis
VPLEKLLPLYRDYDAFVLPTLPGEGIPRVLLEAMTNGTPIVTTRVAGIPSLIRHDVNGWLVDEPSAHAVTEALSKVLTDGPLRRRLIANGYETARGFTLDAQAARMLAEVSSRLPVTLKQVATVPTFALQASVGKPAS